MTTCRMFNYKFVLELPREIDTALFESMLKIDDASNTRFLDPQF